eukprot:s1115_g1.t1
MERLLQAEEGNIRVAQHTAKIDAEITGQKQEVSEEGTKILYGYTSERPQGVPQGFKVFARLDRQARYLKGVDGLSRGYGRAEYCCSNHRSGSCKDGKRSMCDEEAGMQCSLTFRGYLCRCQSDRCYNSDTKMCMKKEDLL